MTHEITQFNSFWLQQVSAPLRLALEGRVGCEWGATLLGAPLLARAPRGDGHPVLVLPLMLGNDLTTATLRGYLARQGYAAHPWGLGINLGPRDQILEQCLARLQSLQREHRRKVSLVGWSLGGLYARELAKEAPAAVRLVITLGTPFTGFPRPADIWRLYGLVTGDRIGFAERHGPLEEPPPVPTTSIFSRSDGIVPWSNSVGRVGPLSENIEIESSHFGLGVNPLALYAIADRLAQPEGHWQHFARHGITAVLYPEPPGPQSATGLASNNPARHAER